MIIFNLRQLEVFISPCMCGVLAVYMYMESTGRKPGDVTRLVSPQLPRDSLHKCLVFDYNVHGKHIGKLAILNQNSVEMWSHKKPEDGTVVNHYNV